MSFEMCRSEVCDEVSVAGQRFEANLSAVDTERRPAEAARFNDWLNAMYPECAVRLTPAGDAVYAFECSRAAVSALVSIVPVRLG